MIMDKVIMTKIITMILNIVITITKTTVAICNIDRNNNEKQIIV